MSYFSCHSSQTLSVLNKCTVTQVPSRLVTCAECRHTAAPFVCPTIPSIKSNIGRNDNHHIVAFCTFRWPFFVFLYFGSYFRVVVFLRSNHEDVLYGSRHKRSRDSKFDLSCRPLSAQRVCMANTRDASTNFMSEVCMEKPMLSKA